MERLPRVTALVVLLALLVSLRPDWTQVLLYDRGAIFEGEIWRVLTGHWVHFSASHLLLDVLAFALVGAVIEFRSEPLFPLLCIGAPCLISAGLLWLDPELARYGGLSGLVMAAASFLGLRGLLQRGRWRYACIFFLLLLTGKIVLEFQQGRVFFAEFGSQLVRGVPLCHALGAAVGGAFFCLSVLRGNCSTIRTDKTAFGAPGNSRHRRAGTGRP